MSLQFKKRRWSQAWWYIYSLSTGEDHKLEARLGYAVIPFQRKRDGMGERGKESWPHRLG